MKLIRFDDADQFYERVVPFLSIHEAEHNLLLGVARGLKISELDQSQAYMACVEEDDAIIAVILRTPPHNVLLSQMDEALIPIIVEDLQRDYRQLRGVFAEQSISRLFAEAWKAASRQPFWLSVKQRIYKLERVTFPQSVAGELRWASAFDVDMLTKWHMQFIEDAGIDQPNRDYSGQVIHRYVNADPDERRLGIWQVDGVPVSMSGYMGSTPNGMRVGAVYTPAEHRRKGYASACVAHLSQHILDMGKQFSFLFTDLANPTSNHIYQAIGYQPISDVDEYRFAESTL